MIDWEAFKSQLQASPQKMLGYVLSISVCFLLIWLLVAIRIDSPSEAGTTDQTGRLDSLRISLNAIQDTPASGVKDQTQPLNSAEKSTGTGFVDLLPAVLILLTAIILLWIWKKRRSSVTEVNNSLHNNLFEIVGRQEISPGQEMLAVKINNEFWVLNNGTNGLRLLQRYTDENWEGPDQQKSVNEKKPETLFSNILKSRKSKEMEGSDAIT